MREFDTNQNANIHRGLYDLAHAASQLYEKTRQNTANWLHVDPEQIAFTHGTTDSINRVAFGFLLQRVGPDDNIVVTNLEHHSNFVPWQQVCNRRGAKLRVIDVMNHDPVAAVAESIDERTRLAALTHISNVTGQKLPVESVIQHCRKHGIPVLVDAAQSAALHAIDVRAMDPDFLVFSSHKVFGPFGIGILYAASRVADQITPTQYGGGMVARVDADKSLPHAFPRGQESGTQNISGIAGWSAALHFLREYDIASLQSEVAFLSKQAQSELESLPEVSFLGKAESGIISFNIHNVHPHDVATVLNHEHIAVRAGRHCAQPLMEFHKLPGTVRASFSIYNSEEDIKRLVQGTKKAIQTLT